MTQWRLFPSLVGIVFLASCRVTTGGSCAALLKCDRPGDDTCRHLGPLMFGPGKGGIQIAGKVTPLDAPTKNGLCQQYTRGSCCSSKFIDEHVWSEFNKHVADITDP